MDYSNPNKKLIDYFRILYEHFKERGDKGRIISYGRIISILKSIDIEITDVSQLNHIRGIGPTTKQKVSEFLQSGDISVATKIQKNKKIKVLSKKEQILQDFQGIFAVGPVKAQKIYDEGFRSISELRKNQELLTTQQKIGLKYYEDLLLKIPRLTIFSLNVAMAYFLDKKFGKGKYQMDIAGSYRRGADFSGDIDCVISGNFSIQKVVETLTKANIIVDILSIRSEKFMGIAHCPSGGQYVRLDIELAKKEDYMFALLYFTGSKEFNVRMRADVKKQGYTLNEHGLYNQKGQSVLDYPKSEKEIFDKVNMKFVPPQRR